MMKSFMLYPMYFYPLILNYLILLILMNFSMNKNFNPIIFMLMLIATTFIITIKMNYMFKSWLSFILFLTMIGGLMVIYMYIISLSNNKMFSSHYKLMIMNLIKMTIIFFIPILMLTYNLNLINFSLNNLFNMNILMLIDQINMNYMYMKIFNTPTIFLMFYLYFTMIVIMNLCSSYKMPLRKIYNI